jgi:hypothetical protein
MTEPEPTFAGALNVTATAFAVHPEGADLSELPVLTSEVDDDEENH